MKNTMTILMGVLLLAGLCVPAQAVPVYADDFEGAEWSVGELLDSATGDNWTFISGADTIKIGTQGLNGSQGLEKSVIDNKYGFYSRSVSPVSGTFIEFTALLQTPDDTVGANDPVVWINLAGGGGQLQTGWDHNGFDDFDGNSVAVDFGALGWYEAKFAYTQKGGAGSMKVYYRDVDDTTGAGGAWTLIDTPGAAFTWDVDTIKIAINKTSPAAVGRIDNLVLVPEPASLALLAIGSALMIVRRRKA